MRKRTALKAIRDFCIGCQGDSFQAVAECADAACPFHPYRHGMALEKGRHSPVRACRKYCFEHCLPEAGYETVKDCGGDTALLGPCPVYPFRLGKNPNISEATRQKRRQAALERGPVGIIAAQSSRIHRPFGVPESTKTVQAGPQSA